MQNSVLILIRMNDTLLLSPATHTAKMLMEEAIAPFFHVDFGVCYLEKEVDAFGQTRSTEHLSKLEHCGAFLLHHCPF